MTKRREISNVITFPLTPMAILRRHLTFVKNVRMMERWRTDFLKAAGKLAADERMALIVAASAKRFELALEERGLEPSRKEGC